MRSSGADGVGGAVDGETVGASVAVTGGSVTSGSTAIVEDPVADAVGEAEGVSLGISLGGSLGTRVGSGPCVGFGVAGMEKLNANGDMDKDKPSAGIEPS